MVFSVDFNCDLGEGLATDAEIMPLISSANIACGYHAGDEATMRRTVGLALEHGVQVGAHPSYPDRANFGRVSMPLSPAEVRDIVCRQLDAMAECTAILGARLHHVKLHGALYNDAARQPLLAEAVVQAVTSFDRGLILFGLSGSVLLEMAREAGLPTCSEVFADRTYQADGSLTPRTKPDALLTDTDAMLGHVLQMVRHKTVTALTGEVVPIKAETICLHGDGPHAVAFAARLHDALVSQQIEIKAP